jgi:hypothetical protein
MEGDSKPLSSMEVSCVPDSERLGDGSFALIGGDSMMVPPRCIYFSSYKMTKEVRKAQPTVVT